MSAAREPLFWSVFSITGGLSLAAIATVTALGWRQYRTDAVAELGANLEMAARTAAEAGGPLPRPTGGLWLTRYDLAGNVLADSDAENGGPRAVPAPPEVRTALERGVGTEVRRGREDSSTEFLFVAYRGSDAVGRAALALARFQEARRRFVLGALALGVVAIGVCGLAARTLVVRFFASLRPLVSAAREVAEGDFRSRIQSHRPDEIGDLARAVDAVADRRLAIYQAAEDDRSELRAILDNAAEGMVVLGPSGRILLLNTAARRIFEAPPDATGRSFVEIVRSAEMQRFLESLKADSGRRQIDLQIGGEEARTVRLAGCRVLDAKGEDWRTILLATDVSDLRRLERMRVDFVANASHELKTPLASILGYAETLREDPDLDAETRNQFLETILRNARRLEDLIGDMLRLTRLESTGAGFRFEPTAVEEVARRAVDAHEAEARQRGVRLVFEASKLLPAVVADAELLFQLFSNLVSNAVKFTPAGGHVDVLVHAEDEGVRVEVADTGVGIAPEHLPRIFERFYRADTSRAREVGGTGLGLAIAKHAATVHGGRIDVESVPGKGTRFRVRLPLVPPAA